MQNSMPYVGYLNREPNLANYINGLMTFLRYFKLLFITVELFNNKK